MNRGTTFGPAVVKAGSSPAIVVPVFSFAVSSAPTLIAQGALNNTEAITLNFPITSLSPQWGLAVKWNQAPYVYRYMLWAVTDVLFPVYQGEPVPAGAYLEVWSADSSVSTISLATSTRLPLLYNNFPDPCKPCDGDTETLADLTPALATIPVLPPDVNCNPFCSPIC